MANVSIKFNGKQFLLSCDDGQEEHLEELLIHINQKFNDLKNSLGNLGENKLLLITAVKVMDEYFETKKKVDQKKFELKELSSKFRELKSLIYDYRDKKENEIQEILDEWVPEHLHGNFNLADEAAKLRKNPLYKTEFKEKAKNARFAEYSMYDKDIDWKTIKARGVSLVESAWGIVPESDNPVLREVIKMNDTNKANEYLRTEGLRVGNEKVKNDYAKAVAQAYGDNIVRSAGFTEGR